MFRSAGTIASISPNSERIDFRFRQVEVDRAAPSAARVENLEQLAHQLEHRDELAGTRRSAAASRSVRMALTAV